MDLPPLPCPHLEFCGGCLPLEQLLRQGELLQAKEREVVALFESAGLPPEDIVEPLAAPQPWGYRRKARLGVRYDFGAARALVGFRRRGSRRLAELDSCPALHLKLSRLILPLREFIPCLEAREQIPKIEAAAGDDGVTLRFRTLPLLAPADRKKLAAFGQAEGVGIEVEEGPAATTTPVYPPESLHYTLPEFGLRLRFRATDFVQINDALNRRLVQRSLELLAPKPRERALDLFCGIGNFTLPLAKQVREVVGIEGSQASVERATENAILNGIGNAHFRYANLYAKAQGALIGEERFDLALIDPPRSGAGRVLEELPTLGVQRLLYVSCLPESLVRDSAMLVNRLGYRLTALGVADMFPTTAHIETLALFARP